MKNNSCTEGIEALLEQLIEGQQKVLLQCAQRIIPTVSADDLWQPNDFPELENNPMFRYEEGVLAGFLSAQMAIRVSFCATNT